MESLHTRTVAYYTKYKVGIKDIGHEPILMYCLTSCLVYM